MEITLQLPMHMAGLLGPILIVVALSEYLNLKIWNDVQPTLIYLNGLFLFTAGVFVVHFHNRWVASWPVVITIVGWLLLLTGAARMFVPVPKKVINNSPAMVSVLIVIFVSGLFLAYKAYLSA